MQSQQFDKMLGIKFKQINNTKKINFRYSPFYFVDIWQKAKYNAQYKIKSKECKAMATVSSGILGDANLLNLKEMPASQIRSEAASFFVPGEEIIQCFMTIRYQVIFTNKRVFVVNVQGITGKKVSYFSYPYSKVQYWGIETAGLMDIDSELILVFNDGNRLQFDFKAKVDIKQICTNISSFVL